MARGATVSVRTACLLLTLVMLLWASGVIVARSVNELMPPVAFSFWRWCVAALVLTPLALGDLRRHFAFVRERGVRLVLLGMFMAGGSTLLVWSVQYTTATNAALVSATQPTVTAVMAWLVLRERLRGMQVLGVAAAAVGIVVMVARMDINVLLTLALNPGDTLVLAAVMFYAAYAVNLHRWLAGLPALLMMYLTALGGVVVLVPFFLLETALKGGSEFHPALFGAIIYMALVPTLLATTLWNISVGVVGPNRASAFLNLLPLFGTALGILILDESVYLYHLVGALFVCIGVSLVVRAPRSQNAGTG